MLIERLTQFFTSPMWAKFIVLIFLIIQITFQEKNKGSDKYRMFHYILFALILRDVVYILFSVSSVIIISDIAVFWMYMVWFRGMKGSPKDDRSFAVFSIVFVVVVAVNAFFPFVAPGYARLASLVVYAHYLYLARRMYAVSSYNTAKAEIILETRRSLVTIPLVVNIFFLLFSYTAVFIHVLVIPLSYFLHYAILLRLQNRFETEAKNQIEFLQNDISTVIDFMKSIGRAIADRLDMDEILTTVVQSASQNTNADGGAILLVEEDDYGNPVLVPMATYGVYCPPVPVSDMVKTKLEAIRRNFETMRIPLTETVLGEVASESKPVFIRDTTGDERMKHNQNEDPMYVSSFIAVPIVSEGKVLGVLSINMRRNDRLFSEQDFDHLKTFAEYTGITMNNLFTYLSLLEKQQMDKMVSIAAEIQSELLPMKIPQLPQLGLAAYSVAAKGVSGDYYDMLPLKRGKKMALLMCDVAGKGIPAAMVMVIIRTIVHLIAGAEQQTSRVLRWINRGIAGQVSIERYATMCYLTYDTETRELEYSNAAHHPLTIYRASDGRIDTYDTPGLPIGLDKKTEYSEITIKVYPGDVMCLYTDGINEAMNANDEQFSTERIGEALKRYADKDADGILQSLMQEITTFVAGAPQHDDQTCMIMKVMA